METVRWVCGVFRCSIIRTRRWLAASFRLRAILNIPVPNHRPGSEDLQDGPATGTSGGVALDLITLRAAIYALEGRGRVTEGSPIDPLLAETRAGISISIRCVDESKAKRAEALLAARG